MADHEAIRKALEECTFTYNGKLTSYATEGWTNATDPIAVRGLLADRDRLAAEVERLTAAQGEKK